MRAAAMLLASLGTIAVDAAAEPAGPAPLTLEAKIPLGDVKGRIDHMAVDLVHRRLLVAELGNDSLGVVDLATQKPLRTISGFKEPQGVGYAPASDTVYVANAGNGAVQVFEGPDLAPAGRIELGEDADNVRVDERTNRVFIGYGSGALAVIEGGGRTKTAEIPLAAHPESFQLDPGSARIFVNLPDARQVAVVDRDSARAVGRWEAPGARANFPMAIDAEARRVIVVFRRPARLVAFSAEDGRVAAAIESCGDADDVFVDPRRKRLYVSCGEGYLDVFAAAKDGYERVGHLPTASGARTSLFVPSLDRLYLAVRASMSGPAAIWVYRPAP